MSGWGLISWALQLRFVEVIVAETALLFPLRSAAYQQVVLCVGHEQMQGKDWDAKAALEFNLE